MATLKKRLFIFTLSYLKQIWLLLLFSYKISRCANSCQRKTCIYKIPNSFKQIQLTYRHTLLSKFSKTLAGIKMTRV